MGQIVPIVASRRKFLKGTGRAVAASALAGWAVQHVHAAESNTLKVALIGCGGRGTGAVTQVLGSPGPIKLWAMADLFPDQIEQSLAILTHGAAPRDDYEAKGTFGPDQIDVPPERRFIGFDAYQQAIQSGIDLVLLCTPPGFRPMHYAAAVAAGKNVFMEKPCCVDAPGFRLLMETNRLAEQKGLKVGVGLQRRHSPAYIEALRHIHDDALGRVCFLRAYWNFSGSWVRPRRPGESELEYQIRNFQYFVWSGGDLIVEAHTHGLDVCNWVLQTHPVEAQGVGGRQLPADSSKGQTFDHHAVEFTYPNGVKIFAESRYMPGCWNFAGEFVHGTNGVAALTGSGTGNATISGPNAWRYSGRQPNSWAQEQIDLVQAVRNNEKYHEGWYGATSSFTAVLGRMATYSGQLVKWDEAVTYGLDEMPKRFAFDADPPVLPDEAGRYPVPIPGIYKPY